MCVVGHGCGGLDGGRDGDGGWYAFGTMPGVGSMSEDARAFPECAVNTLITPDRTTIQVRSSGLGQSQMCRSSWNSLDHGCTPWCSTDAYLLCFALLHSCICCYLFRISLDEGKKE